MQYVNKICIPLHAYRHKGKKNMILKPVNGPNRPDGGDIAAA